MTMTLQFVDMLSSPNFFDVVVLFFVKFNYWSKFHPNSHFLYAMTWELVNLFVGTKIFSYHICYENIAKYLRVKRKTDPEQTELNNMLVKRSVLNEINKFTQVFKNWRKIKRTAHQNLDDLQNLLIKWTDKASAEKAWILSEIPFSLNPGDKNQIMHQLEREDQFLTNLKKKWWNILEAAK